MAQKLVFNDVTFFVGDTILVSLLIEEEGKSRTQVFEGLVISIKGSGDGKTFTVRKIGSNSIGVERILPVKSPFIEKIEVKSRGAVRRSKLYYLRDRVGRRALRVKEKKVYDIKDLTKASVDESTSKRKQSGAKSKAVAKA